MIPSFPSPSRKETPLRDQKRHTFLSQHGYNPEFCVFLAGDASPRHYYRWENEGRSIVLMDTPVCEKLDRFCSFSQFLRDHHLSAPLVWAVDFNQGFMLLEDFGDQTYTRALKSENTKDLYQLAIEVLIHLHTHVQKKPVFASDYTVAEFLQEACLFLEWYYPVIEGKKAPLAIQSSYESLWQKAFLKALGHHPKSLVLRDYHVDNLVVLPDREGVQQCGLLDFQDALWGPVGYDIVSLLEDARRDVDPALKEHLWSQYGKGFPSIDLERIRQSSAIISAGRHLKILGIFTRLALRDGKKNYLRYLPRVWRLLKISLMETKMPELEEWFLENMQQGRMS